MSFIEKNNAWHSLFYTTEIIVFRYAAEGLWLLFRRFFCLWCGLFFFLFALTQKEKEPKKKKVKSCTSGATPAIGTAEGQELASLKQPALLFAVSIASALRPFSEARSLFRLWAWFRLFSPLHCFFFDSFFFFFFFFSLFSFFFSPVLLSCFLGCFYWLFIYFFL